MTITTVPAGRTQPDLPVEPALDHLVYAVIDLRTAVAEFEAATGVRPVAGGRHLGLGTRNYLVGLGGRGRSYLEIIGPDIEHPAPAGSALPFGIESLTGPRLVTWALQAADIASAVGVCARYGVELGPPRWMKRRTPDGRELSWRLATSIPLPFGGVAPFLIDWGSTPHPAAEPSLPHVRLAGFSATHPDGDTVRALLAGLEVELPVSAGPVGLAAVLETPGGRVELS